MILNEATERRPVLGHQILPVGGHCGTEHDYHVTGEREWPVYLCCRPQSGLARSEGSEHSFHLHQSLHYSTCSWHSAVSLSSPLAEHGPERERGGGGAT